MTTAKPTKADATVWCLNLTAIDGIELVDWTTSCAVPTYRRMCVLLD